jgi:glycosyltransferase involved in cell wall biosynthesis
MPVNPSVALVVDALPGLGGAERVLMTAMQLFPQAPIYTLIYHQAGFRGTPMADRQVIASYIDRMPLAHSQYRKYLPLLPHAIQRFDLSRYDLVISFSYAVAHGVITRAGQRHLSYTYTPMRYAWREYALNGEQQPNARVQNALMLPFRLWDKAAVRQVEQFGVISQWIGVWVKRLYRRDPVVIYPPVDVARFSPGIARENYYITVSRLVAHKRIDLIVAAFNRLRLPLVIVGEGPQHARLARNAHDNICFLGYRSDREIAGLLARARGYINASEEDFGISMVEAQAAGCPVIAYRKGGVLETVRENQSGLFFDQASADSLAETVCLLEARHASFNPLLISQGVQKFNSERFLQEFAKFAGIV